MPDQIPIDGFIREVREFNSHLLGTIGQMRQRENELLDRLFSAAASMQSTGERMLSQAMATQATKTATDALSAPPPPIPAPRVVYREDPRDEYDDDDGDRVRKAHEAADRREQLEEDGLLGVPGRDV